MERFTIYRGTRRDEWHYAAALEAAILDRPSSRSGPIASAVLLSDDSPSIGYDGMEPVQIERGARSAQYFLFLDGMVAGPYGIIEIRGRAHGRDVSARTPVHAAGQWKTLGELGGVYFDS